MKFLDFLLEHVNHLALLGLGIWSGLVGKTDIMFFSMIMLTLTCMNDDIKEIKKELRDGKSNRF